MMQRPRTYTNPVYPRNFPDPFVLRFKGRYYAFATGRADDGKLFPLMVSTDLVRWEPQGGALDPLRLEGAEEYWAPEVAYAEGTFYLYFAVGRGKNPDHHLRVAAAPHPLGPWKDAGFNLTPDEIFAIDAHPYRDPSDGQRYLFYARDELQPPFAGTGVVVDRLVAMDRLEGNPRPVVRPYAVWQVFELQRAVKQGLDWYTVEGPFVLRRGGKYVCLYSGGRWENPNYGVAYAVADGPLGPWVDDANAEGPTVLTTVPGQVIGPGHNCVIVGPDLRSEWAVYHGWDPAFTARFPRIDPLVWRDGCPSCEGPTWEPRLAPELPTSLVLLDQEAPDERWRCNAREWKQRAEGWECVTDGASISWAGALGDFVFECSVRAPVAGRPVVSCGVEVSVGETELRAGDAAAPLPPEFRRDAWHTLRVIRTGTQVTAALDDYPSVTSTVPGGEASLTLTGHEGMALGHLALTAG